MGRGGESELSHDKPRDPTQFATLGSVRRSPRLYVSLIRNCGRVKRQVASALRPLQIVCLYTRDSERAMHFCWQPQWKQFCIELRSEENRIHFAYKAWR